MLRNHSISHLNRFIVMKNPILNVKSKNHFIMASLCAASLLLSSCASLTNPANKAAPAIKSTGNAATDRQAQSFLNVQMWSKSYDADPNNVINIIGYSKALSGIGSETRAMKILTDGATKHPNDAGIIRTHAKLLSKQGLVGPALRKMQQALKYAPNDWHIYNDIGGLHSKMGEQALAVDSFRRALKLSPNNPSVHTNLGVTYMFNKQLNLAETHLAMAVKHPKATAKMRQNYAFTLGLQGKYDAARKMFLQDLPIAQVNANIAQLKQLNSQK